MHSPCPPPTTPRARRARAQCAGCAQERPPKSWRGSAVAFSLLCYKRPLSKDASRRRYERHVNRGFYIIMAAQFFFSLADNALLVAALALLMQTDAPSRLTPYLKFFFVIS